MTSLLALLGPTAAGKTRIALDLAPEMGAEVVSVDSMQVYRGMDVGTAKPTMAERARVPHHLVDMVLPGEPFSVAEYQQLSREVMAELDATKRAPMLVGGSGLYFRAIVDNLRFPPTDQAVRGRLEKQPPEELWERLRAADPAAASRMEPANARRIIRALEVIEITARPFSSFRTAWDRYPGRGMLVAGLKVPAETLRRRIEDRTRGMFKGPLLDEAQALSRAGYSTALRSAAAIGYRQALNVLDGLCTVSEAEDETVRATMALSRRQMRWFKRDPRVNWFDATDIDRAAGQIKAYWA
ncbi:MAG: tRNA (adenosine(37)-N6)-dimethylallyltransferase MiaA [Actinomycetota bacterium]